jgi:endonuclease/exonuclease/phosphatase family metal-dependent hydrolase
MKILSLNMWNYNDFDERKPKIIRLIKKHDPDIVALNEIGDDAKLNKRGDNQLRQLNRELNYPHSAFYPVEDMHGYDSQKYKHYMVVGGIGVLSKYLLLKVVKKRLKKQRNDKHQRGILYVKVKAERIFHIFVVHFSNDDVFSILHLSETLDYAKRIGITPVIIGDFNMKYPEHLFKLTEGEYENSFAYKKYFSYPSKKETLDYVVIPRKLKFKSFKCLNENVSDHRALIAEII